MHSILFLLQFLLLNDIVCFMIPSGREVWVKKNVGFEAKSNSHSPFESLDNNKPNLKVTSQNEMGCVGDKNFLSV